MSDYNWREKWQERDGDGEPIEWVVKTCEGWAVKFVGNCWLYRYDKSGASIQGLSSRLLPLPAPPRPWEKPEDVPEEAEWILTSRGEFSECRRLTGLYQGGLSLDGETLDWKQFSALHPRWSATRTGEYRECKVEGGGK